MANVAAIGMMAVVISSFSVSVAAMLGGEEETPEYDDTYSSQEDEPEPETETETETETRDARPRPRPRPTSTPRRDDTETKTPTPAHTGEYEWKTKNLKKLTGGNFIKTLDGDAAKVGKCKKKCEEETNCAGITISGYFGNKTCTLYSGDVSTKFSTTKNSYILRRL